ncbi:MAG: hypothetical protein KA444_04660 [Bacteroidia bacterium]|nr:hypothetical protein [Bacteroidia bacterium]
MKKKKTSLQYISKLLIILGLNFPLMSICQTTADFRSINSGNWFTLSNWEHFDGTTWNAATDAPDHFDGTIQIEHNLFIPSDLIINQTIINYGVELTIQAGVTVTVTNSPDSLELRVLGRLHNSGSLFFSPYAIMCVDSAGTYVHNTSMSSATVLDMTLLHAESNWIYRGNGTLAPPIAFSNRHYGHLVFESTAGSWSRTISGSSPSSCSSLKINLNVMIINNYTNTFTIKGNLTLHGSLVNGTGIQNISLIGPYNSISGSNLNSFYDNLIIQSTGAYQLEDNLSTSHSSSFRVIGILDLKNNLISGNTNNSAFMAEAGSLIKTSHTGGITSSILDFTNVTFHPAVSYEFTGAITQTISTYNSFMHNLRINTSPGTQLTLGMGSIHIFGTLFLEEGILFIGSDSINLYGPAIYGNSSNLQSSEFSSLYFHGNDSGIFIPASINSLKNLGINKGSFTVSLDHDLTVYGTLSLINGIINTENHTLRCEGSLSNGIIGGSDSSFVQGRLSRFIAVGDSLTIDFPVGNRSYDPVQLSQVKTSGITELSIKAYDTIPAGSPDGLSLQGVMENKFWNVGVIGTNSILTLGKISINVDNPGTIHSDSVRVAFSYDDSVQSYTGLGGNLSGEILTSEKSLNLCQLNDLNSADGSFIAMSCQGNSDGIYTDTNCTPVLQLKVFVQGYYKGNGTMKAVVDPTLHPSICDSITLNLHTSVSPFQNLYSFSTILDTSGIAEFDLPFEEGQLCYLSVKTRNTLETWSSYPVSINSPVNDYNFSDSQSKAFGNNLIDLGDGMHALYSGDVFCSSPSCANFSGASINEEDISALEMSLLLFTNGYNFFDLTGDHVVDNADYSLIENNATQNIHVKKP